MYVSPTPEDCKAKGLIYRRPTVRMSPVRQKSTLFEGGRELVQINRGRPIHVGATCVSPRAKGKKVPTIMNDARNIMEQTLSTWNYKMRMNDAVRLVGLIRKLRFYREAGFKVNPIRTEGGVAGTVDGRPIVAKNQAENDLNAEVLYKQTDRDNPPEILKRHKIPDPSGLEFATAEEANKANRLYATKFIDEYTMRMAKDEPRVWMQLANDLYGSSQQVPQMAQVPRLSPRAPGSAPLLTRREG
jgi:hypothetical protein